mmetsp:Transcript_35417/g.108827  ORF Transcript_35417/g.108827 Transcript_35417/m.108827 type:complete len:206 (+) Transcript_35417:513-1130(+)
MLPREALEGGPQGRALPARLPEAAAQGLAVLAARGELAPHHLGLDELALGLGLRHRLGVPGLAAGDAVVQAACAAAALQVAGLLQLRARCVGRHGQGRARVLQLQGPRVPELGPAARLGLRGLETRGLLLQPRALRQQALELAAQLAEVGRHLGLADAREELPAPAPLELQLVAQQLHGLQQPHQTVPRLLRRLQPELRRLQLAP